MVSRSLIVMGGLVTKFFIFTGRLVQTVIKSGNLDGKERQENPCFCIMMKRY